MTANTAIDESFLPSEEDIVNYETHGWYVSPKIFDDALLDDAKMAIKRHHSGARDQALSAKANFADWRPGDEDKVRNNEFFSLQNHDIRDLCHHPLIGAIAARLSRASAIRLFDDQAICKPGGDNGDKTVVGWHTDHSYWSTCTSTRMLTAWIPLQDTNTNLGTLMVIDGSHKWPEVEHMRSFNNPDLHNLSDQIGRDIPEEAYIPIELEKGQVSFHHMRLLHASGSNRSNRDRLAVAVHVQDSDNRYHKIYADRKLVVLPHDEICRRQPNGDPDYTDQDVFPTLWEVN
jgi:ectoine hydroxylase-related dioxygenase (phytanoyl-CoA dioxygenase family)